MIYLYIPLSEVFCCLNYPFLITVSKCDYKTLIDIYLFNSYDKKTNFYDKGLTWWNWSENYKSQKNFFIQYSQSVISGGKDYILLNSDW